MTQFVITMLVCGTALLMLVVLQGMRIRANGQFSTNFSVLFGIVLIATLVAALTFATVDAPARTAAFTLFGTIVGYLVSRKPTDDPKSGSAAKKQDTAAGSGDGDASSDEKPLGQAP